MKKDVLCPFLGRLEILKKIWILIIVITVLVVYVGIFILKGFCIGYKYYEVNQKITCFSRKEIDISSLMEEYLRQLEDDEFYVASCILNDYIFKQICIIPKDKVKEEETKKMIIETFDIMIFCKKVTIGEDSFYFKNEKDKNEFINKINSIKKTSYYSKDDIENKIIITKQSDLEKKIKEIEKEKEREEKERKERERKEREREEKRKISNRNGNKRNKTGSTKVPLKTYSYISSYYGMRNGRMHTGVDFAAPAGTKIYAWKAGKVIQASWSGSYGNFIVIQHNDGTVSRYAHCSGYACSKGDVVSKGQVIGYVGTTGNSTGNHLHLEIKVNGNFVNPLNYL